MVDRLSHWTVGRVDGERLRVDLFAFSLVDSGEAVGDGS